MKGFFDKVFAEPFKDFLEKLADFLPNLFTCLLIIITGLAAAWALKAIITRLLRLVKVDALSERSGITQVLVRGGIKEPVSGLAGRLVYWVVVISFVIMGLDALMVPAVEEILRNFFFYLPNVIVAAAVIGLGFVVSNFLGRAALIASVNAGLGVSGLIGRLVKYTVFLVAIAMALELLGIGKDTVLVAFTVVFGGVVLALSIAFGLGGKNIAKHYIDRKLKEKEDKDEFRHF